MLKIWGLSAFNIYRQKFKQSSFFFLKLEKVAKKLIPHQTEIQKYTVSLKFAFRVLEDWRTKQP